MKVLHIVIPYYNEEEILNYTKDELSKKLNSLILENLINEESKIIFIDDGSKDSTRSMIEKFSEESKFISGIKLSKNQGHQSALLSGLITSIDKCDFTISIDADLQDDIDLINKMILEHYSGNKIVYGVRNDRTSDSFFKKTTAQGFYKFMSFLGADIVYNHADFRLMPNKSIKVLNDFKEVNLFLRGIVPLIGLSSSAVEYSRKERLAGESKYPFKKMLLFALDGITSFSTKPIKFICNLGIVISLISVIMLCYSLISKFFFSTDDGWTSIIFSIWLIGGIQLFAIGIIGEYVAKTYLETKERPRFIIEKIVD